MQDKYYIINKADNHYKYYHKDNCFTWDIKLAIPREHNEALTIAILLHNQNIPNRDLTLKSEREVLNDERKNKLKRINLR